MPQLENNWHSADGKVSAYIEGLAGDECSIVMFAADPPGGGHGRRALQELRTKFAKVRVQYVEGDSIGFWSKMGDEGLIDWACDDVGNQVWPSP